MKLEGSCCDEQQLQCRKRPVRACNVRTQPATVEEPGSVVLKVEERDDFPCLPPTQAQAQRSKLRSMWQLASVLNFLHVFRPVLEIKAKFSAEDLETALITPNATLDHIHIPLLEAILPPRKIALAHDMWVTMLCKTLKDWWPWVAEGELPIIASRGEEIAAYKELVPEIRLLILKALCEIRVEQDDIRTYIDDTLKNGGQLSTFDKQRIGGNAYGTSYWYEDDSTIGHRLYKEIHVKSNPYGKGSSSQVACQWETIATNLDEFRAVLERLSLSSRRVDDMLGNMLKNEILPMLEKRQKQKEQALKRQQRHAMLLHTFSSGQGDPIGRYLRDRKPVNYTYDDFDQSIKEAIQMSEKTHSSPDPVLSRDTSSPLNSPFNAEENGHDTSSQMLRDGEGESDEQWTSDLLEHGNQQRRPQRYSKNEYARAVSGNEADFHSREAVFGEEGIDGKYIKCQNVKKTFNSSDGDGEYKGDKEDIEENGEDVSAGGHRNGDDGQDKQCGTWHSRGSKRKRHR